MRGAGNSIYAYLQSRPRGARAALRRGAIGSQIGRHSSEWRKTQPRRLLKVYIQYVQRESWELLGLRLTRWTFDNKYVDMNNKHNG